MQVALSVHYLGLAQQHENSTIGQGLECSGESLEAYMAVSEGAFTQVGSIGSIGSGFVIVSAYFGGCLLPCLPPSA